MIALKPLLSHLMRPGVAEVSIQTGKRPAARVGGALEDVDQQVLSGDDVLQILFGTGGSRHVDALGSKPTQWRSRVEGVGAIVVSATQQGDVVLARITLRDPPAAPPAPSAKAAGRGPRSARPRANQASDPPPSSRRKPPRGLPPPRAQMVSDLDLDREAGMSLVLDSPRVMPALPPPPLPPPPLLPPPRPPVESSPPIDTPRTMPEAGWGRDPDEAPAPAPGRRTNRQVFVEVEDAPSAQPEALDAGRDPFKASASFAHQRATQRPLAPRAISVPPPALGPSGAAGSPAGGPRRPSVGRTTRPFARDPRDSDFRRLLRGAREAWASDLHLVSGRPPLVRVAGQLVAQGDPLDPRMLEDMLVCRIPARLAEIFDRDGSCDFSLEEADIGRFRINVSRQRGGVKASLRLIASDIPTLAQLGLPEAIGHATRHHQGLIVLTGPTGHGKTTTLAAVVDILNRETTRHIITVEDPIEYVHPRRRAMMSQREVGTHTRSFQTALKASLREDPDVIVVGELRDTETVRMALSASETGHLVIGTMNTPSAAKTIDRLIDLFPPADQQQVRTSLAGGLRLIVSQRLLPDVEGKRMIAAAELLPGMVALWNLIRDGRTYQIPSLQQRGKGLGVIRLDDSLGDLVRAGSVSAASALAVAEAPDELEAQLVGKPRAGGSTSPVRLPDLGPPDGGRQGATTVPLRSPDPRPPAGGPEAGKGFFDRFFPKGS
jgi:twitching motility protein PilT